MAKKNWEEVFYYALFMKLIMQIFFLILQKVLNVFLVKKAILK
jgi:hypothetical protein